MAARRGRRAGAMAVLACALLVGAPTAQGGTPRAPSPPQTVQAPSDRGQVVPARSGVGDGTVIATGLALALFLAAGGFATSGRRRGA